MKKNLCTALAGYFAGYLYICCFIAGFSDGNPPRAWYPLLFLAAFVLWGEVIGKDRRPAGKAHLLFLTAMGMIALAAALGRCRAASGWGLLALHGLAGLWGLYRMGGNLGPDDPTLTLVDGFRAFVLVPFSHFFLRLTDVIQGCRFVGGERRRLARRELLIVLLCVGIALPLLLLAASLLGQADANFGALLEDLSQWQLSDEALSQFMRLLLGLPVGAYLYGLLAGAARGEAPNREAIAQRLTEMRTLPAAAANAVFLMFIALYLLFFGVQAGNLLAVFQGRVPGRLTAAEYARSGFFQLCMVMGINFSLLELANVLAQSCRKSLSAVLMVQSLLLAVTAGAKLWLYISRFGFTPLRLLSAWGVLILAAGCVFVLLSLSGRKNGFRNWLALAVLSFALLCFY